jgi:hypothetical protein
MEIEIKIAPYSTISSATIQVSITIKYLWNMDILYSLHNASGIHKKSEAT